MLFSSRCKVRNVISRSRLLAAAAASIAFVATFAVSARAVIQDQAGRLVYVIVSSGGSERYLVGQTVEVPKEGNTEQFVQIAPGVWAELVGES